MPIVTFFWTSGAFVSSESPDFGQDIVKLIEQYDLPSRMTVEYPEQSIIHGTILHPDDVPSNVPLCHLCLYHHAEGSECPVWKPQ